MPGRSLIWRIAGVCAALTILFVAWLEFAPSQLGGSVAYVDVVGTSMEPRLHRGDLAVLRPASEYQVGDIVAYHSGDLGRNVLHRIVGREGRRYVFKGDNNDYVDPTKPSQGDLFGKLWLRVPAAGNALGWVSKPVHATILAVAIALLLSLGGTGARAVGSRRRSRRDPDTDVRPRWRLSRLRARHAEHALVVFAGIALLFVLLALWAFRSPESRTVQWPDLYRQSGSFSYAATVKPSPVYRSGTVTTGQPIFLELARAVDLRFDYRFSSPARHAVAGTSRLLVRLRGSNGWQRTLLLHPQRPFAGDFVSVSGTLDLGALQKLTRDVERLTGTPSAGYTVSVVPEIRVRGTIADQRIEDTFAPSLPLRFDAFELQLDSSAVGAPVAALRPTKSGRGTRVEANRLGILGLELGVSEARRAAVGGLALLLTAMLLAALARRRNRALDDPAMLEDQYGSLVVDVHARDQSLDRVVEVTTMDGLLRLAKYYECVILRSYEPGGTAYVVEAGRTTYTYRLAEASYGWQPDEASTEVIPLDQVRRALSEGKEAPGA